MDTQSPELRGKMQAIKNLYHSRHYAQCAKFGERLLAEVHDMQPVHLAYINFYTALSHDTLAREATLKNRYKSLKLAELYYAAAIAALAPSDMINLDEEASPCVSPTVNRWKQRRSSNASSFDSSTTSHSAEHVPEHIPTPKQLGNFQFPQPPSRPQTPQEFHFATSTYSFLLMLQNHLASIEDFKEKTKAQTAVRFASRSSWNMTPQATSALNSMTKARSNRILDLDDEEKEEIRRKRRERTWRKRFDPRSVQQLCDEALCDMR